MIRNGVGVITVEGDDQRSSQTIEEIKEMEFFFLDGKLTTQKKMTGKIRQGPDLKKANPGQRAIKQKTGQIYNFQREIYEVPKGKVLVKHKKDHDM